MHSVLFKYILLFHPFDTIPHVIGLLLNIPIALLFPNLCFIFTIHSFIPSKRYT